MLQSLQDLASITDAFLEFRPKHDSNPHQHCVWNCRMTVNHDATTAAVLSFQKEILDYKIATLARQIISCLSDDPLDIQDQLLKWLVVSISREWARSAGQPSDYHDNRMGRACGSLITAAGGDSSHCEDCCTQNGIGPETPEGPDTPRDWGPCRFPTPYDPDGPPDWEPCPFPPFDQYCPGLDDDFDPTWDPPPPPPHRYVPPKYTPAPPIRNIPAE